MTRRSAPRSFPAILAGLILAGAGSCSGKAARDEQAVEDHSIAIVDAEGVRQEIPVPVQRVISLVPSAMETLDALGARDVLVARTDFDTASWAAGLPSVGGGLHPSVETIVSLHPDLVLLFGGRQDPQTPERLRELGIPHLALRPDRIADVEHMIELLGRVTGRANRADSLVAGIDHTLSAVRSEVAGRARPRVAYVLGGRPPWVAGPGTYIDELISIAGGTNVFQDLESLYSAVSPEELVARKIDVVLLPPGAAFDRTLVPGARVEVVPGDLERPGPDVATMARDLARLLHPDTSS